MENTQERETERIEAAPDQGLSCSQVAQRIAAGLDHKKSTCRQNPMAVFSGIISARFSIC